MAKVIGIGGAFYHAKDPSALSEWYQRVLGVEMKDWGKCWGTMFPVGPMLEQSGAGMVLSLHSSAATEQFIPSTAPFMINLCVNDLDGMLRRAAEAGVEPLAPILNDEHGKFAQILDPEGIKIELWEPKSV